MRRFIECVVLAAIALALGAGAVAGQEGRRLRLCADPANLPFSAEGPVPGFEVEIARAVAADLGAAFSVHWFPAVKDFVAFRQLLEGKCDLFMGLPLTAAFIDDKPRMAFTRPYYTMRLVLVSATVGGYRSLDAAHGKLIGVQAMTAADLLVFQRGFTRKIYVTADQAFAALGGVEVDALVMEAPIAGWLLQRHPGFQQVDLNEPAHELPIGAAVRRADGALRDEIDRSFQRLAARTIPDILARYGISATSAAPASPAAANPGATSPAVPPPPPLSPEMRAARSTYISQCSQCHGADARGTPLAHNLQAFKGDEAAFLKIVQTGRPGTAMTPWKGLVPDEDIRAIYRYVKSLGNP